MRTITDQEIQAIIARVRRKVGDLDAHRTPVPRAPETASGGGIHATVDAAVAAARVAFETYRAQGLDARRRIVERVRAVMREHARSLAEMAHGE
ncbi:MAG TPA: aldehyde dehydrogenase family protein, partial [Candidatus Sulfomarinibacteraceae bacterium]|nr:aldehyde dehydrogenase family protein [Candidatus Sulfomarinibacteraceae bacterium]